MIKDTYFIQEGIVYKKVPVEFNEVKEIIRKTTSQISVYNKELDGIRSRIGELEMQKDEELVVLVNLVDLMPDSFFSKLESEDRALFDLFNQYLEEYK